MKFDKDKNEKIVGIVYSKNLKTRTSFESKML